MMNASRIFVAVDLPRLGMAGVKKLEQLTGVVRGPKIGLQLFTAEGPKIVRTLVAAGQEVFLDLKFEDIPNTVAGAIDSAVRLSPSLINLHISGGPKMMKDAMASLYAAMQKKGAPRTRPKVIGVTVLTSLNDDDLHEDGYPQNMIVADLVLRRARRAQDCGLDGVVASPQEAAMIRSACGTDFLIVTPGIQLSDGAKRTDDQKRTATPADAIMAGSNFIVVGRPIMNAADPVAVACTINEEIESALATV